MLRNEKLRAAIPAVRDAAHGSKNFVALVAPSARGSGRGFVLAVFTERLNLFPPSYLESVDASGALSRRLP
jgi:hypothetical protein